MDLSRSALDTLNRAYFSEHPDEEAVLDSLPGLLEGCRHFVDIGASLGQYAFHASQIMHGGRIDAFEPDPTRFAALRENVAKWARDTGAAISAHHLAVGRSAGTVAFYTTQSNVSGGLFPNALTHLDERARAEVKWTKVEVTAISLDEFYRDATPDFIKMDIEGAEGDALLGAISLVRKRRTRWLIELHGFENGWQPEQVIDFMQSHRYRETELASDRYLFVPVSVTEHTRRRLAKQIRRAADRVAGFSRRVRSRIAQMIAIPPTE